MATTDALFLTPDGLWAQPIAEETFARFRDWAEQYRRGTDSERAALEVEGVALGRLRRSELAALIRIDPERALALTVPVSVRRELPPAVASLLEERVSGRGTLAVFGVLPEPGREDEVDSTFRTVRIGGREFEAFVYGWRLGEPTRNGVPLHGIAVDRLLALSANPVRILEPAEAAAAKAQNSEVICSVSGQSSTLLGQEIAAEIGGEVKFYCRALHAVQANEEIIAGESGPPSPEGAGDPEASAWTEGLKSLLLIRVDFPDLTGVSLTESGGATLASNLNSFYSEMSYGRTGFMPVGSGSDVTPIFRMPNPAAWYGTNNNYNQLRTDARNAAAGAGYVLSNYKLDVICLGPVPGFSWSGLGYVGSAGVWLRNSFGTGVAGHELGHNYGLNHANYWDTGGTSTIGPGTSVEYADTFDTMGQASAGNNHFNARYKAYLNWLTINDWVTATTNGTYRIYCHDNPNAPGFRGLRIVKNSQTNYWVEFRQKFTSNKWLMSGGSLRWAQNGNQKSQLLDTTPGSTDGKNDACLVIGRTFSDTAAGIHLTPIAKGGTSPESLDVTVNLGAFPGNLPPSVALSASATSAATGATLTFTAAATDPNGDALAYHWTFGDGNFGTNGPVAARSWSATGEYVVRCVVSDMKGGVGSHALIVTIGSPSTYRLSGTIQTSSGPLQGARVYVSNTRMGYTDSDGTYDIVSLPAGTYTVNASLENYTFAAFGFNNPVSVGPNRTGLDFLASQSTLLAPTITTQPLSQTVNPGANVTFTVGATGSTPLYYQWRFNGANISGATSSSYTKSNVQSTNAGNYSVVVSNLAGAVTSANALLTVNVLPAITAQPQSQTVIAGQTAAFSVTATGTSLAYQWRFNGTNLAGATAGTYSRTNAQPVHNGNYAVVITNSLGAITSAPAALTVHYTLAASATAGGTVTKAPEQSSYTPGSSVTLTATSVSSFPFNGWSGDATGTNNPLTVTMTTNLSIAANFSSPVPDLIVDNPAAGFAGNWTTGTSATDKYGANYRTASSAPGSASATARFTPNLITAGRYDVYAWFPTVTKGAASTPCLVSSSDGDLALNINQSGGSGGWLLLASGKLFALGTNGFVSIANNVGQGGKNVAADAVRWVYSPNQDSTPPTITAQPSNVTAIVGASVTLSADATGDSPLTWRWRYKGGDIPGATNQLLAFPSVQTQDEGDYVVVVANASGAVTSAVATLTVMVPPAINLQPASQTIIAGEDVTLVAAATGSPSPGYQWLFEGTEIPGATGETLDLVDVQPIQAGGYAVVAANTAGATTSSVAMLTVLVPPGIVSPPESQRVVQGRAATLSVAASGTAPLTYQWRFNSVNVAGATSPWFTLPSVRAEDAGDYDVTISNLAGSITSPAASLTVSVIPVISDIQMLDGQAHLAITGSPGDRYLVECSSNMLQWTALDTLTNITGTVQFADPTATSLYLRIYRARLVE